MKRLKTMLFGAPPTDAAQRLAEQSRNLEQAVIEHRRGLQRLDKQMATSVKIAQDALRKERSH